MNRESAKRRTSVIVPIVLIVGAVAGLGLCLYGVGGISVTPARLKERLMYPLLQMVGYLAVGLLVGQIIESSGWTSSLARWVRPLTRWAHFREESGAALVSSFVSGIVANTMLMGFHQAGNITRRELKLAYLTINGLPIFMVHLPTTFFIVTSLAGRAGFVYLTITFAAACLRSLGALTVARTTLPAVSAQLPASENRQEHVKPRFRTEIAEKFRSRFFRLLIYSVPIFVLVFLAAELGFFVRLRILLAGWVSVDFFPVEAANVVIFAVAAEFTSGFGAAGALMTAGTLSVKQTAVALILGTIAAAPVRAIRHQLPANAGIFSLALGAELLIMSQALRILSLILVTIPYVIWG